MCCVCGKPVKKKKSWGAFKNVAGKVMTCDSNKEMTVFLSPGFGKGSLAAMCGISLECCILHPVLRNTVGKAPRVWLIKIATTCLSVYLSDGRNHEYTHSNSDLNLQPGHLFSTALRMLWSKKITAERSKAPSVYVGRENEFWSTQPRFDHEGWLHSNICYNAWSWNVDRVKQPKMGA